MTLSDFFDYKDSRLTRIANDDFAQTVTMINEAYSYQDAARGRPRINLVRLADRAAESQFYVAKRQDTVIGCVYIEPSSDALHFGLLTVAKPYRGRGLAPAILHAIEAHARHKNVMHLTLDYISLAPRLKAYYERYKFHETGSVQEWGKLNLIRMSKELSE